MYVDSNRYKECYKLFHSLGYDTRLKGTRYFFSLVDELIQEFESEISEEEIKEKIPSICLENYHFYLEIKKNEYVSEINNFLESKRNNENSDLLKELFGEEENFNFQDMALILAKYFYNKEKNKEVEKVKKIK